MPSLLLRTPKRDTSSSWQNTFSTVLPPKNTDLDNQPWWESLCGSAGVQRRKSSTSLGQKKKPRLNTLNRVRGKVSLYPCHVSPKAAQLSAERTCWLIITLLGESENIWVSPWLSQLCRKLPKRLLSLLFYPETEECCVTKGQGAAERRADRPLGGRQRVADPINHITDSIRKTAHEPLGTFGLQIPPTDPQSPKMLHTPTWQLAPFVHSQWQWEWAFGDGQWACAEGRPKSTDLAGTKFECSAWS